MPFSTPNPVQKTISRTLRLDASMRFQNRAIRGWSLYLWRRNIVSNKKASATHYARHVAASYGTCWASRASSSPSGSTGPASCCCARTTSAVPEPPCAGAPHPPAARTGANPAGRGEGDRTPPVGRERPRAARSLSPVAFRQRCARGRCFCFCFAEEERAATTSLFRLPLNAMVCFVLFDGEPRATDGGNKDDTARHGAASLALWRPHCQDGIGLKRPITYCHNLGFYGTWRMRCLGDEARREGGLVRTRVRAHSHLWWRTRAKDRRRHQRFVATACPALTRACLPG